MLWYRDSYELNLAMNWLANATTLTCIRRPLIWKHIFWIRQYKYFKYPLSDLIQTVRGAIYPELVPVGNRWMKMLNIERQFPDRFDELQRLCHDNNQTKPTILILKYGKGGHNTLHQDLYGSVSNIVNHPNLCGIYYTKHQKKMCTIR